jgi:hypothetical protein
MPSYHFREKARAIWFPQRNLVPATWLTHSIQDARPFRQPSARSRQPFGSAKEYPEERTAFLVAVREGRIGFISRWNRRNRAGKDLGLKMPLQPPTDRRSGDRYARLKTSAIAAQVRRQSEDNMAPATAVELLPCASGWAWQSAMT